MATVSKKLRFSSSKDKEFFATLTQRVNDYFKNNGITRFGDGRMVLKTIVLVTAYIAPLVAITVGWVADIWIFFGLWVLMGLAKAGIGMSVMHDANHGSYSENPLVNKWVGYIMNLLGGHDKVWRWKHNVLHHTYTNVDGHDEDIDVGNLFRFSPNQERLGIHRFQHIYAWPLYALMSLMFATYSDFVRVFRYRDRGMIRSKKELRNVVWSIALWKVLYYAIFMALPIIFSPFAWWLVVIGFLVMHFVCGLLLSAIFQAAHVMPECEFPEPDHSGKFDDAWAVHQLMTTTNFAPKSKIFSWYIGGLNYQVEHHLFSNISHIHYPAISKIVKATAAEFGHRYNTEKSFFQAMLSHMRLLRDLGRKQAMPA